MANAKKKNKKRSPRTKIKKKLSSKFNFGKIKIIDLKNTLDVYACEADCSGSGPTSWTGGDCYTC